jgi:hypothetical protein
MNFALTGHALLVLAQLFSRSKLYREWVLDQSELLVERPCKRPASSSACDGPTSPSNRPFRSSAAAEHQGFADANPWALLQAMPASGLGGQWCEPLLALFQSCMDVGPIGAASPDANNGAGKSPT